MSGAGCGVGRVAHCCRSVAERQGDSKPHFETFVLGWVGQGNQIGELTRRGALIVQMTIFNHGRTAARRRGHRVCLFACFMVGLSLMWPLATRADNTRVALMTGEGREPIGKIVALAQAKLSAEAGLELLDRDETQRVLKEQKLSLSGVVAATEAIAVGKLLAVDLFAVVEGPPGQEAVSGIVVFDAKTGVRYWDAALPVSDTELDGAVEAVVSAVRAANRKRSQLNAGLHTISLLTVRNADLPRSQDGLCETVGFLIERGLPRSPEIAVLERRRLEHVNEERTLPVAAPSTDLLPSLVTFDLEVSRAEDGRGLQATALLKHAGKVAPETVIATVGEPNAALLADALLAKLIEALHATRGASTSDRLLEARRFNAEATHHQSHRRYGESVRAGEAAHALDPANEDYAERLAIYLVREATYLFSPDKVTIVDGGDWKLTTVEAAVFETLMARATRGVEINSQATRPSAHYPDFNHTLVYLCRRLNGYREVASPVAQERIEAFFELCRRRSGDYIETQAAKAEADPRQLDRYMSHFEGENDILYACSIDTAHYADTMFLLAGRWLAVTKDWRPEFHSTNGGSQFNSLLSAMVVGRRPFYMDQPVYAKRMAPLFAVMREHSRPVVRLNGLYGELRSAMLLGTVTDEVGYARFAAELRPLAQEIIANPAPWHAERTRSEVYATWLNAIDNLSGKTRHLAIARETVELGNFLMSRNEVRYEVVQKLQWNVAPATAFPLIERMSALVDSPQFNDVLHEQTRLRSHLMTVRQELLSKHPELATTPVHVPWSKATRIFDVAQHQGLSDLVGRTIVGDVVYGFCLQFERARGHLRLIRVPLKGGRVELLSQLELGLPAAKPEPYERPHFVTGVCVADGSIYIATKGAGIVEFPLDKRVPRRIGVEDGLPSDKVTCVAVLEGKLYAGVGDGYLISYDLDTRRCDVLASSRRKQKLSPFDDQPPFRVPAMVADPLRKRIVFVIGKGLWQLTPADGKMTQVIDLIAADTGRSEPKLDGSSIDWASPRRGDRLLISNVFRVMEIDLTRDRATLIHSPESGIFSNPPPHLLVHGWLWSGESFARLSLDKREFQRLPSPDKGPARFRSNVSLDLINDGRQILAGDAWSLWLLDLSDSPPVASGPPKPNDPGSKNDAEKARTAPPSGTNQTPSTPPPR